LDVVNDNAVVFGAGQTKALIGDAVASHPKRRNYFWLSPIAGNRVFLVPLQKPLMV